MAAPLLTRRLRATRLNDGMIIHSEDKPLFALAIAFIASTLVLGIGYPLAKAAIGDTTAAFIVSMLLSFSSLRWIFTIICTSKPSE
jgi:hypothetical protein